MTRGRRLHACRCQLTSTTVYISLTMTVYFHSTIWNDSRLRLSDFSRSQKLITIRRWFPCTCTVTHVRDQDILRNFCDNLSDCPATLPLDQVQIRESFEGRRGERWRNVLHQILTRTRGLFVLLFSLILAATRTSSVVSHFPKPFKNLGVYFAVTSEL